MSRPRRKNHKAQTWVKWGIKNRVVRPSESKFWLNGIYCERVKIPRSQRQAARWMKKRREFYGNEVSD